MLEAQALSFTYPGQTSPALHNINFHLERGEIVGLAGKNGSGKSSLAQALKGTILPTQGRLSHDGTDIFELSFEDQASLVAYVHQDARLQIVSSQVYDEIAFGPENLGLSDAEIHERVLIAAKCVGLQEKLDASVHELSGGELTRLCLAAVLSLEPTYLILDEISAHLDYANRKVLHELICQLAQQGRGILMLSQLAEDFVFCDRVCTLDSAELIWQGTSQEFFQNQGILQRVGLVDSDASVLSRAVCEGSLKLPLKTAEFVADSFCMSIGSDIAQKASNTASQSLLELSQLSVTHKATKTATLSDINLTFRSGELALICGASAAGKTTLASAISQLLSYKGTISLDGKAVSINNIAYVLQRAEEQIFCPTVAEEIAFGLKLQGLSPAEIDAKLALAATSLGLSESYLTRSPFDLSGGEQRRVALASMLALDRSIYIFDEPTAALDGPSKQQFLNLITQLKTAGKIVLVITHDLSDFIAQADQLIFIRQGQVEACLSAGQSLHATDLAAAGLSCPVALSLKGADHA